MIKRYNIPILLVILVLTLSVTSFYNYNSQKTLLLEQMRSDADDIVSSITASMQRFEHIKSTMNLQRLVSEVSFGLEIFEFRYLEPDGVIQESMFKHEIGTIDTLQSFRETMQGEKQFGEFFFEERDYVPVMAIYYPIYANNNLIGIIDLAVDVSEYKVIDEARPEFSMLRRQVDIMNLIKSMEGSIRNSIKIHEETDLDDFLRRYVESAENIVQISIVDENRKIIISSNEVLIGKTVESLESEIIDVEGKALYRIVSDQYNFGNGLNKKLLLLIDAAPYKQNEQQLLRTAIFTSALGLFFALFIARGIYYSAIERSREEKVRLERLVKERTHEIEMLSKTDKLTGLWNRCYLDEMMVMEFKRARRYEHDISIIVIDLDHFKSINDNYGHIAGDDVLREVSKRIQKSVRETDFVGRYGGEEMVVILPESTLETAKAVAEQIREKIAEKPIAIQKGSLDVTASLGVSHLGDKHEKFDDLFHEADQALYVSKEGGRNRVTIYNS